MAFLKNAEISTRELFRDLRRMIKHGLKVHNLHSMNSYKIAQYAEANIKKSCGIRNKDYHNMKGHTLGDHNQQYLKSPLSGSST